MEGEINRATRFMLVGMEKVSALVLITARRAEDGLA